MILRRLGNMLNDTVGEAAKSGVNVVSKAVSSKNEKVGKYIGEVGNVVVDASKNAVDSVTQFGDGAIHTGYGYIKKDEYHKQQGLYNLKDSTGRTIKGIGTGIKCTVKSAGVTINGLRTNDREQLIKGLKDLGKVAAVTTFAVGIVDIVDGADSVVAQEIETRNDHLAGSTHLETGVPFETKVIETPSGELVEGSFPVFESQFSVVLAEEMYLESDNTHFKIANETLYQSIFENPNLANQLDLSPADVESLSQNVAPAGYDWHHHEIPGVLQLVDEEVHQNTGHTGGREVWGGGSEYR
jgi:hypothetical protein